MKSEFTFSKCNLANNELKLPDEFDRTFITGLFLSSCIRFYKQFDFSKIKDINVRRIMCANAYNFKIKNNYLQLDDNYHLLKKYNLKKGVIIVNCNSFFDIIEESNLKVYLKDFYFEEKITEKLKICDKVTFKRFTTDTPKLKFKSTN